MQGISVANVLKLDAVYYAGVTLMVGFWLSISNDAAPVADWALFAASYTSLVAVEPLLTIGLVAWRAVCVAAAWVNACSPPALTKACCAAQRLQWRLLDLHKGLIP